MHISKQLLHLYSTFDCLKLFTYISVTLKNTRSPTGSQAYWIPASHFPTWPDSWFWGGLESISSTVALQQLSPKDLLPLKWKVPFSCRGSQSLQTTPLKASELVNFTSNSKKNILSILNLLLINFIAWAKCTPKSHVRGQGWVNSTLKVHMLPSHVYSELVFTSLLTNH